MNPTLHALWMLCALGATVFAAAVPGPRHACAMALGFGAAALLVSGAGVADPALVGGLTVALSALLIARPRLNLVRVTFAGVLSGIWLSLLRVETMVPWPAALAVATALPATSAWLSARRSSFAPPTIRDEATLLVLILAAFVAAAPTLAAGWHSAVALNLQQAGGSTVAVPPWALLLTVSAFALGGLSTAWRRG
jgi:hypothetical protein